MQYSIVWLELAIVRLVRNVCSLGGAHCANDKMKCETGCNSTLLILNSLLPITQTQTRTHTQHTRTHLQRHTCNDHCMCLYLVYDTLTPIRHLLAFNLFAICLLLSYSLDTSQPTSLHLEIKANWMLLIVPSAQPASNKNKQLESNSMAKRNNSMQTTRRLDRRMTD